MQEGTDVFEINSHASEQANLNDIANIINDHIEHMNGRFDIYDGEMRAQQNSLSDDIRARDETVGTPSWKPSRTRPAHTCPHSRHQTCHVNRSSLEQTVAHN